MTRRFATTLFLSLTCAGIGFFIAFTWDPSTPKKLTSPAPTAHSTPIAEPTHTSSARDSSSPSAQEKLPAGAITDERILRFANRDDYLAYLNQAGKIGLTILGQDQRLLAIRVRLSSPSTRLNVTGAKILYQFPVTAPNPPTASAQANAQGFGGNALSWLGIHQDNSAWGRGVVVAVIDSGTQQHPALLEGVSHITLDGVPDGAPLSNHGTAVASIISGDISQTPGIAPSAEILSIRIDNSEGIATTFTLAQGIFAAVDAGAHIINVSMGSYGHSSLVEDAVRYAIDKGVVIVAAAGNEGLENTLPYPAAYSGVISVGAIEANSEHLNFSNTSDSLSITAPGYGINAAWGTNHLTPFSGTSASAPFISGTIAAILSQSPDLSPAEAAQVVLDYTTDAGYPGIDSSYGSGILNLARIMNRNTPDIYDAAIASQLYLPTSKGKHEFLITVQNLGTETLTHIPVSIDSPTGTLNTTIRHLAPGKVKSIRLPAPRIPADSSLTVSATVYTNQSESSLENNSRTATFFSESPQ